MARDKSSKDLPAYCLNCGTPLKNKENFCPTCGQRNTRIKIPFYYLLSDFFRDFLAFDSKLFRSIIPLLFQPGKLPSDFVHGIRARYIPPARLYVFTSIIYFFAISQLLGNFQALDSNEAKLLENHLENSSDTTQINADEGDKINFIKGIIDGLENSKAMAEQDSSLTTNEKSDPSISVKTDDPEFKAVILETLNNLLNKPEQLKERVLKNASFMMLVMLPIFAIFLALFYIRRKRYFIEHFVFSVHFHTFAFISILVLWLISRYLIEIPIWLFVLVLFTYLTLALKRFYYQGYIKSIFKSVLIGITYSVMLSLGIAITFVISVIFL